MSVYQSGQASLLGMTQVYLHPFGHRWGPHNDRPLLANERNMCALSATLRAKPNWWVKMKDPTIRAKWLEEAINAPPPYGAISLAANEVEYVLDELEWYASRRDESTGVEPSVYHRIWQSDTLVNESTRQQLLLHISKLEDVPADKKDWHPGSDGQVLDLVHPSLYCIVYGRTVIYDATYDPSDQQLPVPWQYGIEITHQTVTYPHVDWGWTDNFLSRQFSWLPTDFAISSDGSCAKALGYINNLHPYINGEMYPVIEQLVSRFVPLWERVLAESRAHHPSSRWDNSLDTWPPKRLQTEVYEWIPKEGSGEDSEGEEADEYDEHRNHELVLPPVIPKFKPYKEPPPVDLGGGTLQIIVKLANIHLTPEKPRYPGGSWHVEGMINEAIISTGLYYYDEENITESSLTFRMAVDDPRTLEQDDERAAQAIYGFGRYEPLNQTLGSVVTKQGRCIAFPNCYQHQVQPFELADKSRLGHRKILALFLVEPSLEKPRPSTSNVPPQQADVLRHVLRDIAAGLPSGEKSSLGTLPTELLDLIVDHADWIMSREEAEAYRLELMEERRGMVRENDRKMFAPAFNMCEH